MSFGTGRARNPFGDDDDDAPGFGGGRSSSSSRGYGGRGDSGGSGYVVDDGPSRFGPSRFGGGGRSGYSSDRRDRDRDRGYDADRRYGGREPDPEPGQDEYSYRMQVANRRMEEASASGLRSLNECLHMGVDTAEELERQAETLDRTERRLDDMHVDLDQSKQHMRKIKSPFGGVANYFARRKKVNEVTDPKLPKGAAQSQARTASKGSSSATPPSTAGLRSTGNATVDKNCDEMSKALHQLKGMGELISEQLDDSNVQVDRIQYKIDRTDTKIKGVNRDIRRELY